MRINEIFADLLHAGLGDDVRTRTQNLVRRILASRREMGLCNDVVTLYRERQKVATHLGAVVSELNVLWTLPSVRAVVKVACWDGVESEEEDQDQEDEEDQEDQDYVEGEEEETEDDSGSVGADSAAHAALQRCAGMIQDVQVRIVRLRRQMNLFSGVLLMLHSAVALATIVSLHLTYLPSQGDCSCFRGVFEDGYTMFQRLWAARSRGGGEA